ncbi:MAG TPA: glutamate racemase [Syntrophomonas sp.]|nr:glutamate racemase [Syntrophomonas sp.]
MKTLAPIGVFDSGIGGLSVWSQLIKEIPAESMIYVSDSGYAPYGTKPKSFIINRSRMITRFLLDEGCKLIVVACNTATGAAISVLRKEFSVPFIGVEPAVKPAAAASITGHIGVLATEQTFKGEHFKRAIGLYAKSVEIHERAGNGLVELIESGRMDSWETRQLLRQYLSPMIQDGIDQLVLGCTHYPFLIPIIKEFLPENVHIIDPAPAVASHARLVLGEMGALCSGTSTPDYRFYTTGEAKNMHAFLQQISDRRYDVGIVGGNPIQIIP